MQQLSFVDVEYSIRRRPTDKMDNIIPWADWVAMIKPNYPDVKCGRKPIEIEVMLRMYFIQTWLNLSDEGNDDAVYGL